MILRNHLGEISLESDEISAKITTDRQFYIKKKDDKTYKILKVNDKPFEVPKGMTSKEKEEYLWEFRTKYLERIKQNGKN